MPPITQHHSNNTTKLLLIGDSSSGKTGSLASLAAAGYNLRIIDLDNGVDVLKDYLTNPASPYVKLNPACADNVRSVTLTDPMKSMGGRLYPQRATVWQKAVGLLDNWVDGEERLGPITTWGPKDVLVIDSLTMLSTAALNFHLSLNAALMKQRTQNEGRRDIGAAQQLLRDLLGLLYDSNVKCNVIVTSHITFVNELGGTPSAEGGMEAMPAQGYPSSIGRALSPHIPRYFNSMLIARAQGTGSATRHKLHTRAIGIGNQMVGAKSSAPLRVADSYDLSTGLADYFKAVRSPETPAT